MRRAGLLLLAGALLACSGKKAANYKNCLKLRLGMTREQLFTVMGEPDATIPYEEGKSLPHLKGRTAYEWENVSRFPGPNHVSVEEATGKVASVRCSEVVISAEVFVEPAAVSTAAVAAVAAAALPSALPPESAPDPALRVIEALKTLRPKSAAEGDATADLDAYFSALPGDPEAGRRVKKLDDASAKLLERAALKTRLALQGAVWAFDTPEEYRRRSEQLSNGVRLAQERWTKVFEAESVAERHDAAEDAARRMIALGALLLQDWNPGARAAGRSLIVVGLDLVAKSRRFAAKPDDDAVLRAAKNILPHALALGPRTAEGAELDRFAAASQKSLASLPNMLTRPGGRAAYLDAMLTAVAVKWSEGESRDGKPWPERAALIRLAVDDKDDRTSNLGQAALALLQGLEKDAAERSAGLPERWRLPERF
ncbi:MAG: hypothetical protein SF051_08340 [Elusimicrobiota bacterium]|nr:hypothetical protein [Elusimicrobiota bacterium]